MHETLKWLRFAARNTLRNRRRSLVTVAVAAFGTAGILLAADGLQPSAKGKRIEISRGNRKVVDGPFPETKELVAGFWIWQVKSMDEAVAWARRCPDPMPDEESELEIRPIFEPEDFGKEFTPELREQEERLRAEMERQQQMH